MIRFTLHFNLWPARMSEKAVAKWQKDVLRPLVDDMTSHGDCVVDLTPDRLRAILDLIRGMGKGGANTNSPRLEEKIIDDKQTPVEWYAVDPRDDGPGFDSLNWDLAQPIEKYDDFLSVRADRMKPGTHATG